MITTYLKLNNKIEKNEESIIDPSTVWIDLVNMSAEEESLIENFLGIDIPSKEEMEQIEVSSKLFVKNHATYIITSLINRNLVSLVNYPVTFILFNNILITVRYHNELQCFNSLIATFEKELNKISEAKEIFLGLLEITIEILADVVQDIRLNTNQLNRKIFATNSDPEEKTNLVETLKTIGLQENLISKTEESISSTVRAINYSQQSDHFIKNKSQCLRLITMLTDLHSIEEHTQFLSGSITFLLDALLGLIQIEQNNIVKLVSIISLIFLPPTLIASIYGMNFEGMPELKIWFGYPVTLLVMIISAWLPYKICKKKRWV